MVDPLYIPVTLIAAGFILAFVERVARGLGGPLLFGALGITTGISVHWLYALATGAEPVVLFSAGVAPPMGIAVRVGLAESAFLVGVNLVALLGTAFLWPLLRYRGIGGMVLVLMVALGLNGTIMTRDLFNLFVFVEILSIGTFALMGIDRDGRSLAAGFKYVLAGGLTSGLLLIGIIYLYRVTDTLNIDELVGRRELLASGPGLVALFLVMAALLIELKPFPANGWALDVYESVSPGIVAIVAVGHSASMLFAVYKLLPAWPTGMLPVVAGVGLLTFVFGNLLGTRQQNVRRMLGYSSVAQMGLVLAGLAYSIEAGVPDRVLYVVVGGLSLNHYFAKAGLFWLAGVLGWDRLDDWRGARGHVGLLVLAGTFVLALVGMPPFPGFFGKWHLVSVLASQGRLWVVAAIAAGSLLEAFYLLRWFGVMVAGQADAAAAPSRGRLPGVARVNAWGFWLGLGLSGVWMGWTLGVDRVVAWLPLAAGLLIWLIDWLPSKVKVGVLIAGLAAYAAVVFPQLNGIGLVFGIVFIAGSAILSIAALNRRGRQRGYVPVLAWLVLSLGGLVTAGTTIEFFLAWEFMTVSSYLLVLRGRSASSSALRYILFSLAGAFALLAGFAVGQQPDGVSLSTTSLAALGDGGGLVFLLLAIGFLVKSAAAGVHVWLPGAYAESEEDFSAVISAVLSKAGVFGLMLAAVVLGTRSVGWVDVPYVIGWVGIVTALTGTLLAVFQEDIKYLLAYSSMGQVGLIILAYASMTHLGWLTATYLAVNHVLFKGMLWLAFAGVVYRTRTRQMYQMGGLIKQMPGSFVSVLMAIIALSGVPPLTGFGGKWLLYNALIERGWHLQLAFAFLASTIAFLYCFRLIHTVFLGQPKPSLRHVSWAPWWILAPQAVLIALVMGFSMYPKVLVQALGASVSPVFAATVSWEGLTAVSPLGYWNGTMVMVLTMVLFGVLLVWLLFVQPRPQAVKQFNIVYAAERPLLPETTHFAHNFYAPYQKALGFLARPRVVRFWGGFTEWTRSLAGAIRQLYTGNGQTYALHILMFVAVLYLVTTGVRW